MASFCHPVVSWPGLTLATPLIAIDVARLKKPLVRSSKLGRAATIRGQLPVVPSANVRDQGKQGLMTTRLHRETGKRPSLLTSEVPVERKHITSWRRGMRVWDFFQYRCINALSTKLCALDGKGLACIGASLTSRAEPVLQFTSFASKVGKR